MPAGAPKKVDLYLDAVEQWEATHDGRRPTALELAIELGKPLELKAAGGWFGFLAPSAVPAPILARLSHPRWFYVRNLCLLLGEIGDPAGVPALVRMLSRAEMKVRREAIHSSISASLMKCRGSKRFQLLISASSFFQRL